MARVERIKFTKRADNDKVLKSDEPDEKAIVRAKNREIRDEALRKYQIAYDSRRRYDWEWLTRDLYRRGYHFSRYNPTNRTVIVASRSVVKIPINLLWAQMRAIKNQVVSFRPKWEVIPKGKSEEMLNNARYSGKLLDHYYEKFNLRKMIKETVTQGLIYSVGGPWQIGYDELADDGRGEIYIWLLDPFDFFIDSKAQSLGDAEYCIKAVRRPLDEVKNNPQYHFYTDVDELHGDMKTAASEYKQFLLQALKYQSDYQDDEESAILFEGWMKERVNDDNKENLAKELRENDQDADDLQNGEVLMRVVHFLESLSDPLRVQLIRRSDYPFIIYQADINPLEIYGESWAKHVIPMNRVLDALESSIFQYNYKYAKGRIVIDKNSGVRLISNEHGDIIEKNPGAEVTSLALQPLPTSYQVQVENMRRYIEDVGGAHDVSMGRIPTGVKCVDLNTKCLTKNGFVSMDKLRNGDEIYTVNQKTLKGEWQPLITVHKYEDFDGEIYEIKNQNIDAVVTSHHKWLVQQISGSRKETHFMVETKDAKLQHSILLGARIDQRKVDKAYDDAFVELVGWVLTEGTYKKGKEKSWAVSISQSYIANPDKCEKIIKVVSENTNDFYMMKSESNHALRVNFSKELGKKIRKLFPDKILTYDFVNSLTVNQMEILKKSMILGDGNIRGNNERFFTTDKTMADTFIYMCVLLGYTCHTIWYKRSKNPNLKDYCEISIKKLKYTDAFNTNRKESYIKKKTAKLYVWCPETVNGTFVAERNGSIYVTGNSGVGIAELKQADSTNQTDLVDSLEDFLVNVGKKVLKEIALNYEVPKLIEVLGRKGDPQHFAIIGEKGVTKRKNKKEVKIGPDIFDIAIIGKDNQISVRIGSWLAYTKEAQEDKLKELVTAGIIDQGTYLEHAEFSDIENIIEKTRQEKILEASRGQPAQGEAAISDEEIAEQENIMMVKEGRVDVEPQRTDNHYVHLAMHQEFADNPLVDIHMKKHDDLKRYPTKTVAGGEISGEVPAGMVPPGVTPGQPQLPPQIPGQPMPVRPEELAVLESMAAVGGGI